MAALTQIADELPALLALYESHASLQDRVLGTGVMTADILLVTGPLTRNMAEALTRARAATPEPCWVVALGDCAVDGGVFRGNYAVLGGVEAALPVDLVLPGCPPAPKQILEGLLALLDANT